MHVIEGPEAFSSTLRNKARKYPDREDLRYSDQLIFPAVTPGFTIPRDASVFTIGSCFARNVEEVLVAQGLTVPTASFAAPSEEAPGRPNRILNQYNPGTMLQCLRSAGQPANRAGLYRAGFHKALDCLLATGSRPVGKTRARERRQQIADLYGDGLECSDYVIITLGLVEAWYDREDGCYLNEAPPRKLIEAEKSRFEFRQLGVTECRDLVFEMLQALLNRPARRVILTVSPVPLQVTFAGGDAVTRNAYSKAVLRAVAELAVQDFPAVDYFPSYEIVTSAGLSSFGADNVHVRPRIVERVVNHMVSLYVR